MARPRPYGARVEPRSTPKAAVVLVPIALGLASLLTAGLLAAAGPLLWPPSPSHQLALLHLSAVGGLLPVALGAMTQLASATTGARYLRRQPYLQMGGASLVWAGGVVLAAGFWTGAGPALIAGGVAALAGLGVSVPAPALRAIRAKPLTPLHLSMAVAAASFVATAAVGTRVALGLAGVMAGAGGLVPVHAAFALLVGFGVLLVGVSWQLAGMFAQVAYPPAWQAFGLVAGVGAVGLGAALWPASRTWLPWPAAGLLTLFALSLSRRILARRKTPLRPARLGTLVWAWQLAASGLLFALRGSRAGEGALVLVLFGGFLLAVFTYLDRIVPLVVWIGMERRTRGGATLPKLGDILPESGLWPDLAVYEAGVLATVACGVGWAPLLGLGLVLASGRYLRVILRHRHVITLSEVRLS